MSSNITIGVIIGDKAKKDAIHVAVAPAKAGERLSPGDHITITDGLAFYAGNAKSVGVVDPFLKEDVESGDKFWVFITPGTVTDLRHEWTHPDFPSGQEEPEEEERYEGCRGC